MATVLGGLLGVGLGVVFVVPILVMVGAVVFAGGLKILGSLF